MVQLDKTSCVKAITFVGVLFFTFSCTKATNDSGANADLKLPTGLWYKVDDRKYLEIYFFSDSSFFVCEGSEARNGHVSISAGDSLKIESSTGVMYSKLVFLDQSTLKVSTRFGTSLYKHLNDDFFVQSEWIEIGENRSQLFLDYLKGYYVRRDSLAPLAE